MLTLVDGPCKGAYMCKRAPLFLRAVKGKDNAGNTDVLDQINDKPTDAETVYIYKRDGEPGTVHLNQGGGKGGWYALASYHYLPDVYGDGLRSNEDWQTWALARAEGKLDPFYVA